MADFSDGKRDRYGISRLPPPALSDEVKDTRRWLLTEVPDFLEMLSERQASGQPLQGFGLISSDAGVKRSVVENPFGATNFLVTEFGAAGAYFHVDESGRRTAFIAGRSFRFEVSDDPFERGMLPVGEFGTNSSPLLSFSLERPDGTTDGVVVQGDGVVCRSSFDGKTYSSRPMIDSDCDELKRLWTDCMTVINRGLELPPTQGL